MKLNIHPLSILLGLSLILSPVFHSKPDMEREVLPKKEMTAQLIGSGLNAEEALAAAGLAYWEKPPLAWSCKTTKGANFTIDQKFINGGIVMIEYGVANTNSGVQVFNVASGADLNWTANLTGASTDVRIYACTNDISLIAATNQQLTELHVENLNELEYLLVFNNNITNAQNLTNCTKLKDCLFSYQASEPSGNQIPELRLDGLQNLVRVHATSRLPSTAHITHSMDFRAASQLKEIYLDNQQIPSIYVSGLKKLERIHASRNQLNGTIDFRGCSSLNYLEMEDNLIDGLTFDPKVTNSSTPQAHENLEAIWVRRNELKGNIDLKACTNLKALLISSPSDSYYNQLTSIDIYELIHLEDLHVYGNNLNYPIDLTSNAGLVTVELSQNSLTGLSVLGLANLYNIKASRNQINGAVDFGGCTSINYIELDDNLIDNLNFDPPVSGPTQPHEQLEQIWVRRNEISNHLDLRGCKNLAQCFIGHIGDGPTPNPKNNVPSIDVRGLTNLENLHVRNNALSSPVSLAGCNSLKNCDLSYNQIPNIQFTETGLPAPANIENLWIGYNNFTSLNFTELTTVSPQNIKNIYGEYNANLSNVSIAGLSSLEIIYFPSCNLDNSAIATLTDEIWDFYPGPTLPNAAANSRGSFLIFFNPGSNNLFNETKEKLKCGFGGSCPSGTQNCAYSLFGAGWDIGSTIGYLTINCP
ncbi:MAG: hypothetical protein AAF696_08315 [Bacteroidota bacterium]